MIGLSGSNCTVRYALGHRQITLAYPEMYTDFDHRKKTTAAVVWLHILCAGPSKHVVSDVDVPKTSI